MPYKVVGTTVYVKRGDRWVKLKGGDHETRAEAEAHVKALYANVKHSK